MIVGTTLWHLILKTTVYLVREMMCATCETATVIIGTIMAMAFCRLTFRSIERRRLIEQQYHDVYTKDAKPDVNAKRNPY